MDYTKYFSIFVFFLFGIMIGWACFWTARRVLKFGESKFGTFVLTFLSGGGVFVSSGGFTYYITDKIVLLFHILGLFTGWILWMILAKILGAPSETFWSKTNGEQVDKKGKDKYY